MRPPGRRARRGRRSTSCARPGLAYCSPAGAGRRRRRRRSPLLPFQWRHVDAACVLPPLGAVREQMTGSAEPLEPDRFLAYLDAELDAPRRGAAASRRSSSTRSCSSWFGERAARRRCSTASPRPATAGELWVAPCREVAAHVLAEPAALRGRHDPRPDQLVAASAFPSSARLTLLLARAAATVWRRVWRASWWGIQCSLRRARAVSIRTGRRIASIQAASSGR